MMREIHEQWKTWTENQPAVFITYNGHRFDEELIRRQFWYNLFEPYVTNTNQNGRLDLMLMMHCIASFFYDEFAIPSFEDGPDLSLRLEHIALEHDIDVTNAHDAVSDCKFMIDICIKIKDNIPDVLNSFIKISTKDGIKELLYSNEFLALGEVFRRQSFTYPVVMCGADNSRPNDICFFDLGFEPEEIINLDYAEINNIIQTGGRDGPLKKYKINKTIPVCSSKLLKNRNCFDYDFKELQRRADIIKSNHDFQTKVSQALEDRMLNFPEPEHIEASIYSKGFPSFRDKELMQEFHLTDEIETLIKISRNFEDERFRIFAERIICSQFDIGIPEDIKNRYEKLIEERLNKDGKWGSYEKLLLETDRLMEEKKSKEEQKILLATKEHILSLKNK
tara:strand:+ start:1 stop:1179 length:1179 start_codon:yes stop_codon:yes gene_type:complete